MTNGRSGVQDADMDNSYSRAKDLHLQTCLAQDVESERSTGLETIFLEPGLPDFSVIEVDTSCQFLGKTLSLPLLIAPITGGGSQSTRINKNLAMAAEHLRIGMAVGSMRPMLEGKVGPESYMVREFAPTVPLLANIGLIHVRKGVTTFLKLSNPLGGMESRYTSTRCTRSFSGKGRRISRACSKLSAQSRKAFPIRYS